MNMFSSDIRDIGFKFDDLDLNEIKTYLEPLLKLVVDVCGAQFSVVTLTDRNEERTLATYGNRGDQQIKNIQDICRRLVSEQEVKVIKNLREHSEIKTILTKRDLDAVSFYASAPLKNESGSSVGSLCLFDSKPRDLTESQKEYLQTLADETVLRIQNYRQKKLLQEKNIAESGVYKLKEKFKKVVNVATDLVYELDWDSGKLSWGDELTDILGYPNEERFVDYDWWLDKIHPEDLEKVTHDVALTVDGESKKIKLAYRIRLYDGTYKHVMNPKFIDRKKDGSPDKIIGAIVDISDLKEAQDQAKRHQKLLEELANQTSTAIWIRDLQGKQLFMNQNYRNLFELAEQNDIGKTVHELFDEDKARQLYEKDQKVLETGKSIFFDECVETKNGKRFYKTNMFPISGGKVGGVSIDITDEIEVQEKLKKFVEEKETLLMEIHHRVKNNLAVVSGILLLQQYKEEDKRVQDKLIDSTSRIKTMATIHELLYQSASFTNLKLDENIRLLIENITTSYEISVDLDTTFDLESIDLNINQAIPFSLIVNEVVTNVLKHAFEEGETGTLIVTLFEKSGGVTLTIEDDGKGLPDDFDYMGENETLGLELIDTLSTQLNAEYSYLSLERGAQFKLVFQKEAAKGAGSSFVS